MGLKSLFRPLHTAQKSTNPYANPRNPHIYIEPEPTAAYPSSPDTATPGYVRDIALYPPYPGTTPGSTEPDAAPGAGRASPRESLDYLAEARLAIGRNPVTGKQTEATGSPRNEARQLRVSTEGHANETAVDRGKSKAKGKEERSETSGDAPAWTSKIMNMKWGKAGGKTTAVDKGKGPAVKTTDSDPGDHYRFMTQPTEFYAPGPRWG